MIQAQKATLHEAAENFDDLVTFMYQNPKSLTDSGTMKRYNRFANWWKYRAGHDGSYNIYFEKLTRYESYGTTSLNTTQRWENVGPKYMGQNQSNIGRVNSIWIDPANSNHILIGSASAGMWETTNGGDNWVNLTPHLPGGVSEILVHPSNPSIVYGILTVHINGFHGHRGGFGVFKSTEGGHNAVRLLDQIYTEHKGVTDICFKPGSPDTLYVLTYHSMYKVSGNHISEFAINGPNDRKLVDFGFSEQYPNIGFAYDGIHLYRTTDGGATWSDVSDQTPQDYMAQWTESDWAVYKPTVQNGDYYKRNSYYRNQMAVKGNSVYLHRLRVKDSGNDTVVAFELAKASMHTMAFTTLFESEARPIIGDHRDCFFFKFAPDDKLVFGHINKISYFDESAGAFGISDNIHADVRDIDFYGNTISDFISVTDGGVEYNGRTYINGDLALNEVHGHDIYAKKRDWCHVGTHDDGTFKYLGDDWQNDHRNNEGAVAYQNQENFDIYIDLDAYSPGDVRFKLPNNSSKNIYVDGVGMGDYFAVDPINSNYVWIPNNYIDANGRQAVRFLKYDATNPSAGSLEEVFFKYWYSLDFFLQFGNQDPNFMIATSFAPWSHNYLTLALSHDRGQTWTYLSDTHPFDSLRIAHLKISDIEINPENDNEIWVTMARFMENGNVRVLHTTDKGVTWSDMTSNLPDIPVLQVEYHPTTNRLFVGTEVGLYEYNQDTEEWEQHANFPIVPVTRMLINDIYQDLSVSTYGRGIWRTNLTCLTNRERIITQNQVWNQDTSFCDNVRVTNGATLSLNGSVWQPAAADFIVDENSTLVVNEPFNVNKGVTLTFMPGSRLVVNNTEMQIAEYGTLVFEGEVHVDVNNGTLVNNGQFVYSANDTLNVVGVGTVDLYSEGGTVQQLNLVGQGGSLNFIGRNVTVAGGVAFTNVVLKPYEQMTFDNYIISGLQVDCSNGTAVFANMNGKVFENINVHDGEVQVINSTFSVEGQNIFENTMMTLRNMTVSGGYGAFVLRNSDIKSSDDVIFKQGKNRYGTLQVYRTDNGRTHIGNMVFNSNKVALYSYSGSVSVSKCDFLNNALGWKAVNMSSASSINYSQMADNKIAVDYSGYNNATLKLYDSDIMNNEKGINVSGPLSVELLCSNVNSNSVHGVGLSKDASIIAKTSDLSMNKRAIVSLGELDGAKHLFIDRGQNNLKSFSYCVSGIWSHGSPVYARQNQWKTIGSSPVSGVDYLMFSRLCPSPGNYAPITLIDDNPLRKAPECFIFPVRDGSKSKTESNKGSNLEDLVSAADEQYDIENYKHAAELYYEILMDELNLTAENWDNMWYSYLRFQSLSGLVDNYHILFDLNTIQDHLLSIVDENDYQSRLYLHITKAQTMRLQNNFEGAIDYFNYILSFVNDEDFERISRLRCQVLVDKQILEGEILPFELDESLDACIAESMDAKSMFNDSGKGNGSETEHKYMTISPNPASSSVFVVVELPQSYENCVLQIVNQQQRILLSKKLISGHSRIEFNVNQLEGAGLYFVLIKNDGSVIEANELIVE